MNHPLDLYLCFWEYHRHDRSLKLPFHNHTLWQLNMAESGHAAFVAENGVRHTLTPGDFLFVPPKLRHTLQYFTEPFVGFSFKFALRGEMELPDDAPFYIPCSNETRGGLLAVRELLKAIFPNDGFFHGENLICRDSDYSAALPEAMLLGLFRRFVLDSPPPGSPPFRKQIGALLKQKAYRKLTVTQLAAASKYSPGHLSTLIRKECGLGAKQLIDRERAALAAHLLEFSDLNVAEISEYMQFSSPFAFSNFFRTHLGKSPRSYRREMRGEPDVASGPAIPCNP